MFFFKDEQWLTTAIGVGTRQLVNCPISKFSRSYKHFAIATYKGFPNQENLFYSPLSIAIGLGMVAAGADGNTLKQIKNVLGLDNFKSETEINEAFLRIIDSFNSNSNYSLSAANKIFIQNNTPVLPKFIQTLNKYYKARADNVNFKSDSRAVTDIINKWIEEETNGLMEKLFEYGSIGPDTAMILVDAMYFKGRWEKPFPFHFTKPDGFKVANGSTISVRMMHNFHTYKYYASEELKCKILQMDYVGRELAMYMILPNDVTGLPSLQQQLTPDAFNNLRHRMKETHINVKIPKFNFKFHENMKKRLINMGITDLFDPSKADLSKISDVRRSAKLYVNDIVHGATVKVDEDGTTAAAATGVQLSFLNAMFLDSIQISFVADHPFMFMIYNTVADTVLFIGNVYSP
ncbi:Serpin peptidase inhibitor, clade B (Ovalbumin), member [Chamberlinius hualienensis]